MVKRAVCLYNNKPIGIESIYTVINGQQINIEQRLQALRIKSNNNELFCPCGCGANLTLVAGDKNLRAQHFRLKKGSNKNKCQFVYENEISINSKIILKCWLDEKLKTNDVETRVPINHICNTEKKYEITLLSRSQKIALCYCYGKEDFSTNKLEILENCKANYNFIYVIDKHNGGCNGQYPEYLMKIQNKQGYCLLLDIMDGKYENARLQCVFYWKNSNGLWTESLIQDGLISDFFIKQNGQLIYNHEVLNSLIKEKRENIPKPKNGHNINRTIENVSQTGKSGVVTDNTQKKISPYICPYCNGKLDIVEYTNKKNGQRGAFLGCTNYPKCNYRRSL